MQASQDYNRESDSRFYYSPSSKPRRLKIYITNGAGYFRIGECKLRKIVSENPTADFILWNGNRMQIKRMKFEEFIDRQSVI